MFSGPRYLPLRFKCVKILNQLSLSSGVFIPIASLLFDCLEHRGNINVDRTQKSHVDFSSLLKVKKQFGYCNLMFDAISMVVNHFDFLSIICSIHFMLIISFYIKYYPHKFEKKIQLLSNLVQVHWGTFIEDCKSTGRQGSSQSPTHFSLWYWTNRYKHFCWNGFWWRCKSRGQTVDKPMSLYFHSISVLFPWDATANAR